MGNKTIAGHDETDVADALEDLWRHTSQMARASNDEDTRLAAYAYAKALSLASSIAAGRLDTWDTDRVRASIELDVKTLVQQYRYDTATRC